MNGNNKPRIKGYTRRNAAFSFDKEKRSLAFFPVFWYVELRFNT
jgi:hypothetical protein